MNIVSAFVSGDLFICSGPPELYERAGKHCFFILVVNQVQELHRKLSEETRRADNLAFEMKKLEEKHETVIKEKEVLQLFLEFFFPIVVHILN